MAKIHKKSNMTTYSPFGKHHIQTLLKSHQLYLSKHRGQNYLFDRGIAEKIIGFLPDLEKNQIYLEVGTGFGALTVVLMEKGPTISFEIDKGVYEFVSSNLQNTNLILYHQDFLKWVPDYPSNAPYLFIANLPYSISGEVIKKFINESHFEIGVITLQKEFVDRMTAQANSENYGALSVISQIFLDIENLCTLKSCHFFPEPSIDSTVIKIKKHSTWLDQKEFGTFIKQCFFAKRKTLQNNLIRSPWKEKMECIPKETLQKRPDALTPPEWLKLFELLRTHPHT